MRSGKFFASCHGKPQISRVEVTREPGGNAKLQWYEIILRTIDLRSFSSVWFWLIAIGMWPALNRKVLGAPVDLVLHVQRHPEDGQAARDLFALVRMASGRIIHGMRSVAMVAGVAFAASGIVTLALFGSELAQAAFCILAPLAVVRLMSLRLALGLSGAELGADALCRRLLWHRMAVQLLGFACLFLTALFGLYRNLTMAVLH